MNEQIVLTVAQAILKNTEVLAALVDTLPHETRQAVAEKVSAGKPKDKPKPEQKPESAPTPSPAKPAEEAPEPAAQPTPAADAEPAAESPSEQGEVVVDFKRDLAPAFTRLVGKRGRDAGFAIIEHFKPGAKRLSEALTEDQYAECLAMIQEQLED